MQTENKTYIINRRGYFAKGVPSAFFRARRKAVRKTRCPRQGVCMQNFNEFIKDLAALVSYKSVESAPEKGKPFGAEADKALSYFLSIAEEMGFATKNYDGYAGEITFGEGEEIGIIGHLDVVPAGTGWESVPFTLTFKDGYYYGRGVQDDKGPLLQCLYALKELKDSGLPPKRKFRLFVGCNEETGWKDVEYLEKNAVLPEYGFSPDGNFPLSYAEKGIGIFKFYLPPLNNFYDLTGGTAVNAVCAYASCRAKTPVNPDLLIKHGLTLSDGGLIESRGVAAHGSAPHLGKNALLPLFNFFADSGENVYHAINCLFFEKRLGALQNEQGKVTFSPDLLAEEKGKIKITCDCRIPAPLTLKDVCKITDTFGIEYSAEEKHPPLIVKKEGWFAETLLSAYKSVTGEDCKPLSMGGSTFARAFRKGCAFGCKFPGVDAHIHDANERVSKENLIKSYKIYKEAIFALAKG